MGEGGKKHNFLSVRVFSNLSLSPIARMLRVKYAGIYILSLERFCCGDETPAVVTAIRSKTCEFIVASFPVATINRNGRDGSNCASRAIERNEEEK